MVATWNHWVRQAMSPRRTPSLDAPPALPAPAPTTTLIIPSVPPGSVAVAVLTPSAAPAVDPVAPVDALPTATSILPQFSPAPDPTTPGHRRPLWPPVDLRAMLPWRLLAAGSIAIVFALSGVAGAAGARRPDPVDADHDGGSIVAGVVGRHRGARSWTYSATENARRLVAPATTTDPPDPKRAMVMWAPMMIFIAAAAIVVVALSVR